MTAVANPPLHGWTQQQLESLPHWGKVELVNGKIIMSQANFDHGFVSGIILSRLLTFVLDHNLGVVVDSSTGFRMESENVLSPDVSFVAADRLKSIPQPLRKFFRGSPDLVVEILSPTDSRSDLDRKLQEYFANDTRLAWIVDPIPKTFHVHRKDGTTQILTLAETVSGEDVVPGFTLNIADLFRPYSTP